MPKMPFIAIVGRPNVGKELVAQCFIPGKASASSRTCPGVTLDRISTPLPVKDRYVELVDTGGYGSDDEQGLTEHIKHQIEVAKTRADLKAVH